MSVNLAKMQNKVNRLMSVFTNIVEELTYQIVELNDAIEDNNQLISKVEAENKQYAEKIDEYKALRDKVESIVK